MKRAIEIVTDLARYAVGILFIFSGIVKANDPLGFSYKLEEYFIEFPELGPLHHLEGMFAFLHDWAQHIVDVNSIFRNDEVELEQMLLVLEEEFLPYDEASLWQVANAVLEKQDDRQSALRSKHSEDIFVLLQQALREKNAQLNFIRALNDTEDLS